MPSNSLVRNNPCPINMYNNKGITAFNAMEKLSNESSPFSGS